MFQKYLWTILLISFLASGVSAGLSDFRRRICSRAVSLNKDPLLRKQVVSEDFKEMFGVGTKYHFRADNMLVLPLNTGEINIDWKTLHSGSVKAAGGYDTNQAHVVVSQNKGFRYYIFSHPYHSVIDEVEFNMHLAALLGDELGIVPATQESAVGIMFIQGEWKSPDVTEYITNVIVDFSNKYPHDVKGVDKLHSTAVDFVVNDIYRKKLSFLSEEDLAGFHKISERLKNQTTVYTTFKNDNVFNIDFRKEDVLGTVSMVRANKVSGLGDVQLIPTELEVPGLSYKGSVNTDALNTTIKSIVNENGKITVNVEFAPYTNEIVEFVRLGVSEEARGTNVAKRLVEQVFADIYGRKGIGLIVGYCEKSQRDLYVNKYGFKEVVYLKDRQLYQIAVEPFVLREHLFEHGFDRVGELLSGLR